MRETPWNGRSGTATGTSDSAPATATSSSTAATAASIVPLLEVDDLDQASADLARGGAELLGEPESDCTWTWLTFRVPDVNIHSLGARMA
jgi:hypothetical protein